ncbi:MAG: hypothetical protein IPG09_14110 [Ignavibacteria bacterium]|nr:hypothetical protein [Ignavibacteria bacterium]
MQQNKKTNIEDIYELSSMQQGMLFHTLYTEGSDAYIEQFCYDLTGEIDIDNFRKSWQEVINRHQALRTSFQWKGISKPVQLVSRDIELPWEFLDWSGLTQSGKDSEYVKFIREDRVKGFSMEQTPLMRCTLIKYDNEYFKFVWSFHHILMDGWSYPILQKEVFTFYEAFKNNKELILPKPLPYKSFIQWTNQQDRQAAEIFWKKELKGFTAATPLKGSTDKLVSANNAAVETDEAEIKISGTIASGLSSFAKKNQLTLNTIIQGVWSVILSAYRGESDVLFGGVISGRNPALRGIETMVGLFINTLPVRVNVDLQRPCFLA